MSSHPEDFHARVPVDRVAKRVTSPGVNYEWEKPDGVLLQKEPPSILPKALMNTHRDPSFFDYSGLRLGCSVVIGLPESPSKPTSAHKGRLWVLRCSCGNYYETRLQTIKNLIKKGEGLDCRYCRHVRALAIDHSRKRSK